MPCDRGEPSVNTLRAAVEGMHGCQASYRAHGRDEYEGRPVWEGEGDVDVFRLKGYPIGFTCYAWSAPVRRLTAAGCTRFCINHPQIRP